MPGQTHDHRWSDDKLEEFYQEFMDHIKGEEDQATKQAEIHTALFQLENRNANKPAGVVQMLSRLDERLETMEITADRQKRFIGGFLFAFSCVGFFFTDVAHRVVGFFKSV